MTLTSTNAAPSTAASDQQASASSAANFAPTEKGIALRGYLQPHLASIKITTDASFAAAVDVPENVVSSWYRSGNLSRKNAKHVSSLIARPLDELLTVIGKEIEVPSPSAKPKTPAKAAAAPRPAPPKPKKPGSRSQRAAVNAEAHSKGDPGSNLLAAAYASKRWFLSLNDQGLTLDQHLAQPTLNCTSKSDEVLARSVASWIAAGG